MSNHGTSAHYDTGCRCTPCRQANNRRVKAWNLKTRHGTRPIRVPLEPVRRHVIALRATGWTLRDIAAEAGISFHTVKAITANTSSKKYLTRGVAARVLAVEPLPDLADYIDPVVVDRIIAGTDWRTLPPHPTHYRAERIAAAERLAWHWTPIRARQAADGTSPQALDGESLTSIERRFGLRAGRDFRKAPDAVAQRGAA